MAKSSKAVQYSVLSSYLRGLAKSGQLPSGFKLDQASTIVDPVKFVESELSFLEAVNKRIKSGDKVPRPLWNPSYDRLQALYFYCKQKKNQ